MPSVPTPDDVESIGLPPVDQIGFVVRSLEETKKRYGALFGPFTQIDGSVQEATYRGELADARLAILFGRSGDLEIEFIEWQDGASPHREFIEQGREGMHHLRYRVDDVDGWIEKLARLAYRPIWYKKFSPEISFSYLERDGDPLLIELLRMP
jgi:catechol 2,3-dioxygenase-like lactoylglutathione lyase family enzyme